MENATKALLIAGAFLIAIIIISVGVGMYFFFSTQASIHKQKIETTEIQKFNSNFDSYVGETNIRPQEIVTLVNKADELEYKVVIYIKEGMYSSPKAISSLNDSLMGKFINGGDYYSCTSVKYDETDGRIKEIVFTKN